MSAPVDTDRMAETRSGSGRSLGSAVTPKAAGAQPSQPLSCSECGKGITIASIKKAVAKRYRISELALLSRQNRREISHPRQTAMAMARSLTDHTRATIGRHFGGRHPTTVLYAERMVIRRYIADSSFGRKLDDILLDLQRGGR